MRIRKHRGVIRIQFNALPHTERINSTIYVINQVLFCLVDRHKAIFLGYGVGLGAEPYRLRLICIFRGKRKFNIFAICRRIHISVCIDKLHFLRQVVGAVLVDRTDRIKNTNLYLYGTTAIEVSSEGNGILDRTKRTRLRKDCRMVLNVYARCRIDNRRNTCRHIRFWRQEHIRFAIISGRNGQFPVQGHHSSVYRVVEDDCIALQFVLDTSDISDTFNFRSTPGKDFRSSRRTFSLVFYLDFGGVNIVIDQMSLGTVYS